MPGRHPSAIATFTAAVFGRACDGEPMSEDHGAYLDARPAAARILRLRGERRG